MTEKKGDGVIRAALVLVGAFVAATAAIAAGWASMQPNVKDGATVGEAQVVVWGIIGGAALAVVATCLLVWAFVLAMDWLVER